MPPLLLASGSAYRRELLSRLRLPFDCAAPQIDESPLPGEDGAALAMRLAQEKAQALASRYPEHLIIGSDQVAVLDGQLIGKPGSFERAREQLRAASGRSVSFLTGLCLHNARSGRSQVDCVPFTVHFRQLDDARIERYLRAEQPYDCAGSAKSEGLGIALLERIDSDDPTALVGLPLIRTCQMLRAAGVRLP